MSDMSTSSDFLYAPNILINRNGDTTPRCLPSSSSSSSSSSVASSSSIIYFQPGECPTVYTRRIRIVHISDTHKQHDRLSTCLSKVSADILIHSGDFSKRSHGQDLWDCCASLDSFFASLTGIRQKVLVAGNSEIGFNGLSIPQIRQLFPKSNTQYLQDDAVELFGLKLYGSPWTSSSNMGFSAGRNTRQKYWDAIPKDVDILITHMAPFNVLDLASTSSPQLFTCEVCGEVHRFRNHWGCEGLRSTVLRRVRPAVHCFGHIHEGFGWKEVEGVLCINAAQMEIWKPIVWEVFINETTGKKKKEKTVVDKTEDTPGKKEYKEEQHKDRKTEESHEKQQIQKEPVDKQNKSREKQEDNSKLAGTSFFSSFFNFR